MSVITINAQKADEILALGSSTDSQSRRYATQLLREMQAAAKARQKRIHVYNTTILALEQLYAGKRSLMRQQMRQMDTQVAELNHQIASLIQERDEFEDRQKIYEQQIQEIRAYAQERYNKKAKRQRQYNQFYNVPVLASQYKKKYIRAQDKNNVAEEQVSQVHDAIETCQESIKHATKLLTDKQKQRDEYISLQQENRDKMTHVEDLFQHFREGQAFWERFSNNQLALVIEAAERVIGVLRHGPLDPNARARLPPTERDWTVTFRSVCHEYGEREAYGVQQWETLKIEFECTRCHMTMEDWPVPDKVRTSELLCKPCYKETRSSMIVEKKMNALGGKLGMDRPVSMDRRKSSSSSLLGGKQGSIISTSSSLVGDAKKAFKGILSPKMLRNS